MSDSIYNAIQVARFSAQIVHGSSGSKRTDQATSTKGASFGFSNDYCVEITRRRFIQAGGATSIAALPISQVVAAVPAAATAAVGGTSVAHTQAAAHVALSSLSEATSAFVSQSRTATNMSEASDRGTSPTLSCSAENSGAPNEHAQGYTTALGRESTIAGDERSASNNGRRSALARDFSKKAEVVIESALVEAEHKHVDLYISTTSDLAEFASRIRESSVVLKRTAGLLSDGSMAMTVVPIAYETMSGKKTVPEGAMHLGLELSVGEFATEVGGGVSAALYSSGATLAVSTATGAGVGLGIALTAKYAGQITNRVLGEANHRIIGPAASWLQRGIYSVYHVPYGP